MIPTLTWQLISTYFDFLFNGVLYQLFLVELWLHVGLRYSLAWIPSTFSIPGLKRSACLARMLSIRELQSCSINTIQLLPVDTREVRSQFRPMSVRPLPSTIRSSNKVSQSQKITLTLMELGTVMLSPVYVRSLALDGCRGGALDSVGHADW